MIHLKAILIGLALASPPVAAWVLRGDAPPPAPASVLSVSSPPRGTTGAMVTRIPVEIVANGSESKWVYVEAPIQSVPEPGVLPLAAMATGLLLRRRRPDARRC